CSCSRSASLRITMYFFFGISGDPLRKIFNQTRASSKSIHQFHCGELLGYMRPMRGILESNDILAKDSPGAQAKHTNISGNLPHDTPSKLRPAFVFESECGGAKLRLSAS